MVVVTWLRRGDGGGVVVLEDGGGVGDGDDEVLRDGCDVEGSDSVSGVLMVFEELLCVCVMGGGGFLGQAYHHNE